MSRERELTPPHGVVVAAKRLDMGHCPCRRCCGCGATLDDARRNEECIERVIARDMKAQGANRQPPRKLERKAMRGDELLDKLETALALRTLAANLASAGAMQRMYLAGAHAAADQCAIDCIGETSDAWAPNVKGRAL